MLSMPKNEAFECFNPNQIAPKHNIVTISVNAEAAEHFETWGGGLIVHRVKHIPLVCSYFPKWLLRCSLARTNFFAMSSVSNVSVLDSWQCCLDDSDSWCF